MALKGEVKQSYLVIAGERVGAGNPLPAGGPAKVVTVTPVLDTSQYADGDVLFNPAEIAGAVLAAGGAAWLTGVVAWGEDDQGQPFDLIFLDAANNLGTLNAAPSISDANGRAIIGRVQITSGDFYDLGGARVADVDCSKLLQAAAGETSLYVAAISRGTGTYSASGLKLKFRFAQG